MRTFDQTLAAVFIVALSSAALAAPPPAPSPAAPPPDASAPAPTVLPPVPRHKPDPKDEAYSPKAQAAATSATTATASIAAVPAPASVAGPTHLPKSKPFPRAKPTLQLAALHKAGPFPRVKPEVVPLASAAVRPAAALAPPATAPTPVATPTAPTAPPAPAAIAAGSCGDACNEVIFRMLGDCLWVQNANPRPVAFAAKVGDRTITLALAGANAGKADAHKPFEPKEGYASPIGEGAYHTRISDPFSPSAPGIAVYRARLGSATDCVKDSKTITGFTASFAAPVPASASK